MNRSPYNFLTLMGFSHWADNSSFWKCKCACGKIVSVDRRRLKGNRKYKSCGCLKNKKSITCFYTFRRCFFNRIHKQDSHWIYSSNAKGEKIRANFGGGQQVIQRIAYMLWHHKKTLPHGIYINNTCGIRECVCPWHLRLLTIGEMNKINRINKAKKGEIWKKRTHMKSSTNSLATPP